jgi:citrate lyase subunit beta/citryl-CoA lyase
MAVDFDAVRAMIKDVVGKHRKIEEMVKGANVPYYRRGEMSIPAFKMKAGGNVETDGRENSLKLMGKAAQFPIDFFFYDLEYASPDHPEYKVYSREFVVEALTTNDFGNRVVAFRPNNVRTPYFEEDLLTVLPRAGKQLQAMVIPKTETADEIKDIVKIIKQIQKLCGQTNTISLEVLIESPKAFTEAHLIAAIPDVSALIFGAWDFARTIGGRVEADTWIEDQAVARQLLPIMAAAYGKDAVDAVTGTLPIRPKPPEGMDGTQMKKAYALNPEQLDESIWGKDFVSQMKKHHRAITLAKRDAENARRCGYAAKWILHPDQIDVIQGAWTPSREDAKAALKLAADYTRAARTGSGAEVDGDRLADKAVVGTDWWLVRAALQGGILTDADIQETGFSLDQLERTVRTHD